MAARKSILSVLLFVLGSVSLTVQATQWREVGEVRDTGTIVYVDDSSLTVDHDTIVKGWVRFEYDKPRERDGYRLDSYASQRMVDCAVNRYWQLDGWGYRSKGEPVRLYSTEQQWQTPAPDSESEIASAVLCNETKSIFGEIWDKLAIVSRLQMVWKILTAVSGR